MDVQNNTFQDNSPVKEKIKFVKSYVSELFDEDKLRFFFLVVILIGLFLWLSNSGDYKLFLVLGLGLLSLLFLLRPQHDLIEPFVCSSSSGISSMTSSVNPIHDSSSIKKQKYIYISRKV